MFRSYQLCRVLGIPVRVHSSLLFFLPILALSISGGSGTTAFLVAIALIASMFSCVLLHELGHSVAALWLGIPVRGITLTPIGGVAALDVMPRNPVHELLITIAGPAVNFVLAAIFFAAHWVTPYEFFAWLIIMNLVLGIFNLLPGFPMDGGRILRALLALKLPYLQATKIAVRVGQVVAIAMGVYGLIDGRIMLILIAAFVYFSAGVELRRVSTPQNPIAEQLHRWLRHHQRMGGSGPPHGGGVHGPHVHGSNPAGDSDDRVVLEVWPNGEVKRRS